MTRSAEVVVVGGGVIGASIAFHLAERGVEVCLVEKGSIAGGPTGRSCGIIRQHYSHPVTVRMALRSLRFFEQFRERVGGECDFRRTGYLLTAGPEHIETLRENVAMQQALGVNTRVISVDELRELEPGVVTDGIVGAAYEPDSGYADPYSTTAALVGRAEELGAEILTGSCVRAILVEQGRVAGVDTDSGEVRASSVVLAAGPWSPRLVSALGIELPITPCRVQVCLFQRAADLDHEQVFIDSTLGVYTRPEGEDMMLVGSVETNEARAGVEDPDHFQRVADFDAVERYSRQLVRRFPAMDKGGFVNGYASLYDVTPDWQPILDRLPGVENLYCAAGSSGHGFKLAPLIGEMMAGLVAGGRGADRFGDRAGGGDGDPAGDRAAEDDIRFFGFYRFAHGRAADGGYAHKILG